MSVLSCSRRGCENIMCDLLSDEYGYLCHECYVELRERPGKSIKKFMNTPKHDEKPKMSPDEWEEHINTIFKSRHE